MWNCKMKINHKGGIIDPILRNNAASLIFPYAYLHRVARYAVSIKHRRSPFRCNLPFHVIPMNGSIPMKDSPLVFYNWVSLWSNQSSWTKLVGRMTSL